MKTRTCDFCKKPMLNSWCGEWLNGKFIEVHQKCKEDWKKANEYVKETITEALKFAKSKEGVKE